jgi:hypothetical protein
LTVFDSSASEKQLLIFSIHPLRKSNFLSFDFDRLIGLLGFDNYDELKDAHFKWVDIAIQTDNYDKDNRWTQSIAA